MKHPLKTLGVNLHGSDYVIGDLHGCYNTFQYLLKNINFDTARDRMISVGDLVDRGSQNLECLELLYEPWFHAVLGNHEQMMLEKMGAPGLGSMWFNNGGQWAIEAVNDKRSDMNRIPSDFSVALFDVLPIVDELPYLITVKMKDGKRFHVLHAELPALPVPITDEILEDQLSVHKIATTQCYEGDSFVWHRCIFYELYERDLTNRDKIVRVVKYNDETSRFNANLSHIISGHTTVHRPLTVVGQTNIDTGAWQSVWRLTGGYSKGGVAPRKWAALTCIELNTWKFYQATETTFVEVEPFTITQDDLSNV